MELIVIGLILLEVIIGVGGIVYGVREANEQAAILNQMNTSAATTATMMKDVKTASLEQAAKLRAAVEQQDSEELFRLLGTSESQRAYRPDEEPEPAEGE